MLQPKPQLNRLVPLLLLLALSPTLAADLRGRVICISDGDTLTLLTTGQREVKGHPHQN